MLSEQNQVPTQAKNYIPLFVVGVVSLVAIGIVAYVRLNVLEETPPPLVSPTQTTSPNESLGEELYDGSNNPIKDQLPETSVPLANPINDAYKNPFQ